MLLYSPSWTTFSQQKGEKDLKHKQIVMIINNGSFYATIDDYGSFPGFVFSASRLEDGSTCRYKNLLKWNDTVLDRVLIINDETSLWTLFLVTGECVS